MIIDRVVSITSELLVTWASWGPATSIRNKEEVNLLYLKLFVFATLQ